MNSPGILSVHCPFFFNIEGSKRSMPDQYSNTVEQKQVSFQINFLFFVSRENLFPLKPVSCTS